MKYMRILLKLSGEALGGGEGKVFSPERLALFAEEIGAAFHGGAAIGIVLGGGNIFRGARSEGLLTDRVSGDYMGMLATIINSMALRDELLRRNIPCELLSGLKVDRLCGYITRERILSCLSEGKVVLLAGGTGNPFFTTDSAAALRAVEMEADVLIKGTRVDGVYSSDPEKNADAVRYDRLTYDQALREGLQIMDHTAFTICRENGMPLIVYNAGQQGALKGILEGRPIGSLITP